MAVHMVRVLCEPPRGDAETAINNWVTNYTEWTDDPVDHSLTAVTAGLDNTGTEYVRGDWRFIDNGEDKTAILDDLSGRLQSLQGGLWHRLGYHRCTYDESAPPQCAFGTVVESGTIPSDIPTLQ